MNIIQNQRTQQTAQFFYTKLLADLTNYGLSPQDWHLRPHQKNSFLIQNKSEKDFIFEGHIDPELIEWKLISLVAI